MAAIILTLSLFIIPEIKDRLSVQGEDNRSLQHLAALLHQFKKKDEFNNCIIIIKDNIGMHIRTVAT